jgi:hypothetical protein
MAPFPAPPPQEPALEQLGVEPVGLGPAMLPRYRDTRGMDHVRFDPARIQPTRQPEAIAAGFEGQCNPRDLFTGPDRFIAPAMPQAKKPFRTRFQLLLRLTLNAGKHPGNQPARLAHLDDGNDCAILVQRDEGPDQSLPRRRPGSFSWGIGALRQLFASDDGAISFAARPIASLRWREMDSNRRYPAKETTLHGLPPFDPAIRLPQQKPGSFATGTDSSNPSPSRRESRANSEIADKLREAARSCQFAGARREILHLAARFESRADHLDRRAGSITATRLG